MRRRGLCGTLVAGIAAVALTLLPATATAKKGDLYVADYNAGAVLKVDPGSGAVSTVVSDPALDQAAGIEFAPDGSLLVADYDQIVYRVDPSDGSFATLASSPLLNNPTNAFVAPGGEIFLTDQAGVFRVTADAGVSEVSDDIFGTGLFAMPNGKLIVADRQAGGPVVSLDPQNGSQSVLADGDPFSDPFHLDRAPNGVIYVADTNAGVIEIPRDGPARVASADPEFDFTYGVALAPSRDLYVTDYSDGQLFEVDPRSGDATVLVDTGEGLNGPLAVAIEPPKCKGKLATIVGSKKKDKLKGSKFKDVIVGLKGNDRIKGGKGKDRICGGKGKDKLTGNQGRDKIIGGPGKDKERQ